jgi:DNA-binding CsgD family transcriptional regulator
VTVKSIALLTESVTSQARSGNPLELLPPRERAVITLLGAGMEATTVAKLLCITRETLYQDRRRAWRTLAPVVPSVVLRAYRGSVAPWQARRPGGRSQASRDGDER